ncbi:MAG: hypothetical protein C6I00_06920 [Nitratiruptor sp.]|nr:hypothetical protein [Nitratiruptor sp.]NPA83769.1 hypothetical protein [Campylobacterota bacterium]
MLYDLLQDRRFAALLRSHSADLLTYLLEEGQEFAVVADLERVTFEPPLPKELFEALPEFPLFLLVNYTFQTARLEGERLRFEAGFGPQNFGSLVSIPLDAIVEIVVDETPIFINLTATIKGNQPSAKDSMEIFLSNPENQKFLNKG